MMKDSVTIHLPSGLETRPVAMLVQIASQFQSRIFLESGTKKVNAKSIMGMMSLGLDTGETVTVAAEGTDEKEALESICRYLAQ